MRDLGYLLPFLIPILAMGAVGGIAKWIGSRSFKETNDEFWKNPR